MHTSFIAADCKDSTKKMSPRTPRDEIIENLTMPITPSPPPPNDDSPLMGIFTPLLLGHWDDEDEDEYLLNYIRIRSLPAGSATPTTTRNAIRSRARGLSPAALELNRFHAQMVQQVQEDGIGVNVDHAIPEDEWSFGEIWPIVQQNSAVQPSPQTTLAPQPIELPLLPAVVAEWDAEPWTQAKGLRVKEQCLLCRDGIPQWRGNGCGCVWICNDCCEPAVLKKLGAMAEELSLESRADWVGRWIGAGHKNCTRQGCNCKKEWNWACDERPVCENCRSARMTYVIRALRHSTRTRKPVIKYSPY